MKKYLAPSSGLRRDRSVAGLLGDKVHNIWFTRPRADRTVVGWGQKRSGRRAERMARRTGADLLLLEDGFLRSVGRDDPRIGINFDSGGMHYDARSNSRLFDLIDRPLSKAEEERAASIVRQWRAAWVSKYNAARDPDFVLPDDYVLVIDQVRDDRSIEGGCAKAADFARMLEAALAEHPTATVMVKLHPDAADNPRKRHFALEALQRTERVLPVVENCHIAPLIAGAKAVYAVTSQVGFEALLWGKPVRCFGMPFYAGRGLTQDEKQPPTPRADASLAQLVHAALIDYPRYWNPISRREIACEEAIALVGLNRNLRGALPRHVAAAGFSPWKRTFVRDFLAGSDVTFIASEELPPDDAALMVWGRKPLPPGADAGKVHRIEDGFLRSVGLGADLVRPVSLVVDGEGIYYDATEASALETLLADHDFTDAERWRAASLRERIVAMQLSKYNLGGEAWRRPASAKHVLLVVGQVADDASIRLGSPELKTGGALLKRVRALHPDAYIVYKPHPDVVAGLRAEGDDDAGAMAHADAVVTDVDPVALLDEVDGVHVMSSLLGFEALLRGKPVTCHGLPFYAGWGLTEDRLSCDRRGRSLTLDELVYATLIAYPRYRSQRVDLFAPPEDILDELTQPGQSLRKGWRKPLRPLFRLLSPNR